MPVIMKRYDPRARRRVSAFSGRVVPGGEVDAEQQKPDRAARDGAGAREKDNYEGEVDGGDDA
eukprot:CAMPEP_0206246480 /NCGR_PEP_ID=MMETSP0047_2-20121206/19286_1 /ASSEMBLY_ACC=CAM_ASM_000192 /TAXON_ID=195065 /ORGANISM="Chroomonas mesostigmatica_cf, Strain CCMP1168" /LENGTH=62 /DNA_ID=CAMNT_0053671915 /DNA_START=85 /DNA_END=269 /DNA_ORIENTATION=-